MAELTVCMNVYNGAEFLPNSIGSVLKQTYQDFEILVYDDGSTDNTIEVARSLNDSRIRIVEGGENKGILYARAKLIPLIETPYCIWLDDDDFFCRDDALEFAMNTMKAENYDFLHIYPMQYIKNGTDTGAEDYSRSQFSYFGDKLLENYFPVGRGQMFSSKVFKTELIKQSVPPEEDYVKRVVNEEPFFGSMWFFLCKRFGFMTECEPIYGYNYLLGECGANSNNNSPERIEAFCYARHDALISSYKRLTAIRPLTKKEFHNLVRGMGFDGICNKVKTLLLEGKYEEHTRAMEAVHKWLGGDGIHLLNGFDDKAFEMPEYIAYLNKIMTATM